MTNTTQLSVKEIEANIKAIEQVMASMPATEQNATQITMLQQQLVEYKSMLTSALPAVDETSAADINIDSYVEETDLNENTKGEITMTTTTNTEVTNTTKGENTTMTNNTNTTVNNTTKGEIKMTNKTVVFTAGNLQVVQNASGQIAKALFGMGVKAPLFSQFIGTDATALTVDARRNKFVVTKEDGTEVSIQFSSATGKQVIDYLMVVMPGLFPKFMESPEFKALEKLNLKGRLTAKAKVHGKKTRETVLMAALNMGDIYVVSSGEVLGKLVDFDVEELMENVMVQVGKDDNKKVVLRDGVRFYIAKDTNVSNLTNVNSLFQKMSGSLAAYRFAMAKGKKTQTINVIKEYSKDGMTLRIEEPQKAVVLDEMCTFDGSASLPFGEEVNGAVLKAVFSEVSVLHREDGQLEIGSVVSEEETFSYKTYAKSMSQARSNGAVGFKTLEDVITYFLGTGQDERAYGKKHKLNGEATGYNVMDVAKSYKRFMLAGSNGLKADKGLLSTFSHNHTVEFFPAGTRNVIGEIKPAYIVVTNNDGEKITIALVDDFTAQIAMDQDFMLNVLNKDNAFVGVEKFNNWDNKDAVKDLLFRNLTDGQGWHNRRVTEGLRSAGVINSFDAFQLRISNAVKGASFEFNPICELFNADIILTDGMVKSEDILADIQENGFQLFVVGQRKDGNDGIWVASQATQQMGLSVEELKQGVTNSVDFVKNSIEEKMTSDILTMLNAAEEEAETEFAAVDYVRLAQEFGDILDEQYIKDEIVGLGVKKLNKLLDSKLFTTQARTRYMFTDVFAIYNAAKDGRYTATKEDAVLGAYEVVAPSKKDDKFFLETGKALSVRFPVTVTHEIPVVTAVQSPEYAEFVEQGLWQGITFFDAFSWVVAQQAGADHDGDTSIIIFDELMVNARIRKEVELYGNQAVLPFVDAYVKYENGVAVEFGTGCPTYVTAAAKAKETKPEAKEVNGFIVQGNNVIFNPEELKGENGTARRHDFLEVVAGLSQQITVDTIEASLIGVIANRAMILTDLLSRSVLNAAQRAEVEADLLALCTAGRWEIDRPKHGGAYLSMPLINKLFANFEGRFFEEAELELTNEAKFALLAEEKGIYAHIFSPVVRQDKMSGQAVITGFEVKKPQWLASQKDEFGVVNNDSAYEFVFNYAEEAIVALCEKFQTGHSNTAKNEIRTRIATHMEVAPQSIDAVKYYVANLYNAYTQKENVRAAAEKDFMMQAEAELKEAGVFRKKNMQSLTKAKKTAKIRANYDATLSQYKMARDLYKAELRKEMYATAKELGLDVRQLVGALYLLVNEAKTNGKAAYRKDGREYRFVASNGFIALPFEVFAEEMNSLISGKVSETYFVPQDITFTLLQSSLVEKVAVGAAPSNEVKVRVMNPVAKVANKTVAVNRNVRVAIKPEQQKDSVRLVMYFLNKDAQVADAMAVTREDAAYMGFAPANFSMAGIYEIPVTEIAFGEEGTTAIVRF
ncbi:hypothetical protein PDL67_10765 [Bacillus cereus]|uniref:hypothetical protein n=1 Tax=Bacillus cereus group sp. BcHK140 TaxID=3018092 RepID=UPI0022E067B3|nr:hypothetical protein [Bacillus cereus group sp. BcHK140]MDA1918333.1 hypothetical protein [Bacillus cereus group sp. BcHK140]MDA1977025.1 hypothetical protein [Bacillus cereus]